MKKKAKNTWGLFMFFSGEGWQLMVEDVSKNHLLRLLEWRERKHHDSGRCTIRKMSDYPKMKKDYEEMKN